MDFLRVREERGQRNRLQPRSRSGGEGGGEAGLSQRGNRPVEQQGHLDHDLQPGDLLAVPKRYFGVRDLR